MSTGTREDPVLGYNFRISLLESSSSLMGQVGTVSLSSVASPPIAGFSECSGLESALDVQEYLEGGNNGAVLKFPTRVKPANIVLKRGMTSMPELWNWHYSFAQGMGKRRDGVIIVLDSAHQPHTAWGFRRGLPLKYSGPPLHAGQSSVAIESIEIAHEGLYQLGGASVLAAAGAAAVNAITGLF